jgi:hypothetical protein
MSEAEKKLEQQIECLGEYMNEISKIYSWVINKYKKAEDPETKRLLNILCNVLDEKDCQLFSYYKYLRKKLLTKEYGPS